MGAVLRSVGMEAEIPITGELRIRVVESQE